MSKWSDAGFLDALRHESDELANDCARRLIGQGESEEVSYVFRNMTSDSEPLPGGAPPILVEFFEKTGRIPSDIDRSRIEAGERAFMKHAFTAALVLLCKSLPEGYAAPSFGHILNLSRDLEQHPYRRLLGVLQLLVNVSSSHGFEDRGKVVVTAQKMRLLHAALRTHVVPRQMEKGRIPSDFIEKYGTPINFEDMLATIMGFSFVVIEGLRILRVPLSEQEAEDLYYLWSVYARLMGIHPVDAPDSWDYVPRGLGEASEFYRAYSERNYVSADENPKGGVLAQDNIDMLEDLLPAWTRPLGLKAAPRIYTWELAGPAGCARVGIEPVAGHALRKWLLSKLAPLVQREVDLVPESVAETVARTLFGDMIRRQWGGEVTFLFPDTLQEVRQLA
jgi:ER-bound oxygenase mpaB/B'/Rubber oxygenase, catalytic domain